MLAAVCFPAKVFSEEAGAELFPGLGMLDAEAYVPYDKELTLSEDGKSLVDAESGAKWKLQEEAVAEDESQLDMLLAKNKKTIPFTNRYCDSGEEFDADKYGLKYVGNANKIMIPYYDTTAKATNGTSLGCIREREMPMEQYLAEISGFEEFWDKVDGDTVAKNIPTEHENELVMGFFPDEGDEASEDTTSGADSLELPGTDIGTDDSITMEGPPSVGRLDVTADWKDLRGNKKFLAMENVFSVHTFGTSDVSRVGYEQNQRIDLHVFGKKIKLVRLGGGVDVKCNKEKMIFKGELKIVGKDKKNERHDYSYTCRDRGESDADTEELEEKMRDLGEIAKKFDFGCHRIPIGGYPLKICMGVKNTISFKQTLRHNANILSASVAPKLRSKYIMSASISALAVTAGLKSDLVLLEFSPEASFLSQANQGSAAKVTADVTLMDGEIKAYVRYYSLKKKKWKTIFQDVAPIKGFKQKNHVLIDVKAGNVDTRYTD